MVILRGPAIGSGRYPGARLKVAALFFCFLPVAPHAAPVPVQGGPPCRVALQPDLSIGRWEVAVAAEETATLAVDLPSNRNILLVARESGLDADVQVTTSAAGAVRSGNPVRRNAVIRLVLRTGSLGRAAISVHATAADGPGSHLAVEAFDNDAPYPAACRSVTDALAAADSAFGRARLIATGHDASAAGSADQMNARAYQEYLRAFAGIAPENLAARAEVAHALATLLTYDIGQWHEAEHWAALATGLFRSTGNEDGRASAESLQALTWTELADLPDAASASEPVRRDSQALVQKALRQLKRLAAFYEMRREPFDAALQLNLAGVTLFNIGDYDGALKSYRQAQALFEQLGQRYRLALVLQNIALVDWDLGRSSVALATFEHALSLLDPADSPELYASILDNDGLANRTAGHLDTALALHAQASDLAAKVQDDDERGRSLFGTGMVYSAIGDRPLAADFLRQALNIFEREDGGRDLVSVLRALAMIASQDGHHEEAIRLDREALTHATGPIVRVHLLAQIAQSESVLGRYQAAADDMALAGKIPESDDSVSRGVLELARGDLYYRAGRLTDARAQLRSALQTDRSLGLDAAAFDADVALARVDIAAGDRRRALRDLDAGLQLSEALRAQISNPELRATSMQPLRPAFEMKVDLLAEDARRAADAGDSEKATNAARAALAVTERSRARVLRDIALTDYTHGAGSRADQLLGRKSRLLADIAAHEDRLETGDARSVADPRLLAIRSDVARLREQLALLDSQLAMLGGAAAETVRAGAPTPAVPPSDVAILSYWLGDSHGFAWAQTRSRMRLYDLGPADVLRTAASSLHTAYTSAEGASLENRLQAGATLSRLILQPVLADLPAGITRLVIVPDGPLHYVSFAALPVSATEQDSFLVAKYEVSYGSSVTSVLATNAHPGPAEGMLLVADAVYSTDDPRFHPATPRPQPGAQQLRLRGALPMGTLQRLPATAAEASGIVHMAAPLKVDDLEGFDATREGVLSRPLERYRYIHFAVHATTDSEIPQMSSLVLSTYDVNGHPLPGRIWAGDLMGRRFNARTIVLSACDTGLGRDIGGEGLFSLRYVALARGAQSVVASLWAVPDRSTASLMQVFYKGLLSENRRPESALTEAMRQMLHAGPRDPLFWAPFTATIASLR